MSRRPETDDSRAMDRGQCLLRFLCPRYARRPSVTGSNWMVTMVLGVAVSRKLQDAILNGVYPVKEFQNSVVMGDHHDS